jgi:hypothetical protein
MHLQKLSKNQKSFCVECYNCINREFRVVCFEENQVENLKDIDFKMQS